MAGRGDAGGSSTAAIRWKKSPNNLTLLVVGDDGVGKSSLVSTFVSRHFSEVVPGVMTRVRLPPDPSSNNCITTIVDSRGADASLASAAVARGLLPADHASSASLAELGKSTGGTSSSTSGGGETSSAGTGGLVAASSSEGYGASSMRSEQPESSAIGIGGATASSALLSGGMGDIDAIVLVYDLDRVETFYRLENHWLPLIERCFSGELPVIIAGNKMDLFSQMSAAAASDEQALARSRQQIVSILQRFKFVRQCIKCSAKNLLNVDEVFLKAQQAVLYPITPLYNLNEGRIADNCRKALARIFRIYDKDNDGLLSNAEINQFQSDAFSVPLVERDLAGWKKVVSKNNPTTDAVIREGKFTVPGFLAIFDVFITQNRLEVPWKILRYFHYDDELNLEIPEDVISPPSTEHTASLSDEYPSLSLSARKFLTAIFHQFDSDSDGVLSTEDVLAIFSVIPEPSLPPWHPLRARDIFRGCFSMPKIDPVDLASRSTSPSPPSTTPSSPGQNDPLSASELTILSGASLPSVEISGQSSNTDSSSGRLNAASALLPKSLSYMDWMGCWHLINTISPSRTRTELFRLGHVEAKTAPGSKKKKKHGSSKKKAAIVPAADYSSIMIPSKEVRVLVLGSKGCGKTALLNALCISLDDPTEIDPLNTNKTSKPESCSVHIRINMSKAKKTTQSPPNVEIENSKTRREELVTHLIFTEVPAIDAGNRLGEQRLKSELEENCDLVALAFDCGDSESLSHAQTLEEFFLSDGTPRVYVATKADDNDNAVGDASPIAIARRHCANLDLEPPLLTSATASILGGIDTASYQRRENIIEHLARCALDDVDLRLKSTPHAELKRQEAARRKRMVWLGGFVCASVAVALGVGALLSSRKEAGKDSNGSTKSWLKSLLSNLGGGGSSAGDGGSQITTVSTSSTISVE